MHIAFFRARKGKLVDWLIDLFTGLKGFSHMELVFSDGQCFSAQKGDKGTRYKNVDFDAASWIIIPLTVTDEQEVVIRSFCDSVLGKEYDIWGALGVILPFRNRKGKWFCSEVVVTALQEIGMYEGIDPAKVDPNWLWEKATSGVYLNSSRILHEDCHFGSLKSQDINDISPE
jgi:hypothetical protein